MGRPAVINLDTNVLVRWLVHDDPPQSEAARRFVAENLSADAPGFVTSIAVVELCWVLESIFELARPQIGDAIRRVLATPEIRVQNAAAIQSALAIYDDGADDIADALIAALGEAAGCGETVTFDRRFARQKGVRLLR